MSKLKLVKIPEYERGRARGFREGNVAGYEFFGVCMLLALKDKFDVDDEFIMRLHDEIVNYTDLVRKGYFSFDKMKKTLLDEYNIVFTWKK